MSIELGGEKAWAVYRVSGGLILSYEWLDDEPCLCVFPERQHGRKGSGALVVPLSCAHQWATADGYPDLRHAVPVAVKSADMMGLSISRAAVRHIIDAVVDGLPDLLRMPKRPRSADDVVKQAIGDIKVVVNGRVTHEAEISV